MSSKEQQKRDVEEHRQLQTLKYRRTMWKEIAIPYRRHDSERSALAGRTKFYMKRQVSVKEAKMMKKEGQEWILGVNHKFLQQL